MRALGQIIYQAAPCAYYVGGSVRDGILKRRSADIDLALPKNFVKPASVKLARLLRASAFEMDAGFCVWRVTLKTGLQIDLSALIGKDIYEDLRRRDFTVNAMACPTAALPLVDVDAQGRVLLKNLKKAQVIDLNGGFADIKAKTIRANAANIFTEDPLRLLRAFRAAAELNFKIAPATLAQIKKHSALISKPAGERVQEELKRIFAQNNTAARLADMDKARLLTAVFPALEDQKTTARVYYGKGGVFTHTLLVAQRVEYLLNHLKTVYPQFYKRLLPFVGDAALYKMAALLHDIAKPKTAKVIKDRLRFFYHEEKGAKMAREILQNLKYSGAEIKMISKMIEFHLRPSNLASNEIITDKGVYKFFKELGEAGVPMLLLCWADYTSYVTQAQVKTLLKKAGRDIITIEEGKKKGAMGKTLRHLQVLTFLLDKYFNQKDAVVLPKRLLDGREVMRALNIKAGPLVGRALEAVTLAQVEGRVKDKASALDWLKRNADKI